MKKLHLVSVVLIVLMLADCSKKESSPPPVVNQPKKILSLTIDASYTTSQADNWVLLHDSNGKLIDYKSFESGDIMTFQTTKDIPGNKISVTFFEYIKTSADINHNLQSYLLNDIGQDWTLKKVVPPALPAINSVGTFTANVTNMPPGSGYQFSTKNHFVFNTGSWDGGSNTLHASVPIFNDANDYFFFMSDNTGTPRYKFFRNVINNDAFTLSYNGMTNFDKTVKITFPPTKINNISYWINNIQTAQPNITAGFLINSNLSSSYLSPSDLRTEMTLGYLDTFALYNTIFTLGDNALKYLYAKVGAIPSAITLPLGATFTLKDKTISNYNFDHTQAFSERNSLWLYQDFVSSPKSFITWEINAGSQGLQKITELPSEFLTKYPILTLDKSTHISSTFTTQGDSYLDLIDYTFKGKIKSPTYEYYNVIVN